MIRRKSDCIMDVDNKCLVWKNQQGYTVIRKFFTRHLLEIFYESLDG